MIVVSFQNKNAATLLEYERMADFGFEKRDFRKVLSYLL